MQKTTIVLNFANDKGNYRRMQTRLYNSLISVGYDGDIWLFNDEKEISEDCPTHEEVPYAFKAFAIKKAIDAGYENIIWMDSAVYAVKPIDTFLHHIKTVGFVFFDNIGFTVGDYTSDACLDKFGWSRQRAFDTKMIMACCFGINVTKSKSKEFFDRYLQASKDGVSYLGAWINNDGEVSTDDRVRGHRHDQSVASIVINELNMEILRGQSSYFAYFEHKRVMQIASTVCLFSQGI
jgi:hypothetical protein